MNLTLFGFRLAARALPLLPGPLVSPLSAIAGWGFWLANGPGRRAVRANLRIVLRREPSSAEIRAVFITAAQNYCDLFFLPRIPADSLIRSVEIDGWENLAGALRQGKGALLASLHLGNIEVVGKAAALRGLEIVLPVERLEPPELLDLMIGLRERVGFRCEPVGETAFDRIRDALRRNCIVGIGADRITLGEGELVTFEEYSARMPVAAAVLALRTGAPLLPYASQRLAGHRFRLRIGEPIPVSRSGRLSADARSITESLLRALGVYLRDNPTQWVVFRRVWESDR